MVAPVGIKHFREPVQGLWTEYQIHMGRAAQNGIPFLTGHATADTDDHRVGAAFKMFPAAQLAEHFFLGFFPDRAGVNQDDIGFCFVLGEFQTM